jgi:hypothetical protein
MTAPEAFVTQAQVAELVQVIDHRMSTFERAQNRMLFVLGSAQVLTLVLLVLVLRQVGLS